MSNQIQTEVESKGDIFIITPNVRRAAEALKMMLPYGHLLTIDNAIALHIYGRIHDLDALNGECYFLVREKTDQQTGAKTREEMGCYPGIKGKRKKAREQSPFKVEYSVIDPTMIGLRKEDIAVCVKGELRDNVSMGQYIVDTLNLSKAGLSKEDIERIIGKPPVVTGYGMVRNRELGYLKQEPLKVARKRAENDCITQRFDLPLTDYVADDVAPELVQDENGKAEPIISVQLSAVPEQTLEEMAAQAEAEALTETVVEGQYTKTEAQLMMEMGFGG